MKVALALLVLCVVVAQSEAHFRAFGGFGGFGIPRFGGFGWGFPRFGWGMGMGAPWMWNSMAMNPLVNPLALNPLATVVHPAMAIGKRDAEGAAATPSVVPTAAVTMPTDIMTIPTIVNRTVCSFATKKSMLSCTGNFNFECDVVSKLSQLTNTVRVQNLTVIPDEVNGTPIFRLFSRTNDVLNNFSVVDKSDKQVVLSIYNDEKFTADVNGIFVKDTECWTAFVHMVHEIVPVQTVRFSFFVDTVNKE